MSELAKTIADLSPQRRQALERLLRKQGVDLGRSVVLPRRRAPGEASPLSFAQLRLWVLDRLEPGSAGYNVPVAVRLLGPLDVPALDAALAELVRRHEALRTRFDEIDGEPVQVAGPPSRPLRVVDLLALPAPRREAELARLAAAEARRPFDLTRGPLLRSVLVVAAATEHAALLTMHHIVSDAWSTEVLVRELVALYGAFAAGAPSPLPEPPIQYADFAVWQRERLQGEELERQLGYWRRQLAGLPALELPLDRPRPAVRSGRGGNLPFALSPATLEGLRALSRRAEATLFMTLLTAFQAILGWHAGQDDVAVGTPIAGRTQEQTQDLIGFFVNTLVLRTDLSDDPELLALLRRVRAATLAAYAHQDLPFERLVGELQPERDLSRTPLFQVMFSLQEAPAPAAPAPGLRLVPMAVGSGTAKFDLTLGLTEGPEGLAGDLEYDRDLFDAPALRRLLRRLERLLEEVAVDPERPLSTLLTLAPEERQQLREWNDTAAPQPAVALYELFETQAARVPDAVALVAGAPHDGLTMTYAELARRAGRLAERLLALGLGPEDRVGVCLERSPEAAVAILAALAAGAAYVPLDPAHPRERLAFVVEDAGIAALLTREELAGRLPPGLPTILVERDTPATRLTRLRVAPSGENSAYVLYTSGSTGRPKGVVVPHRAAVNLALAVRSRYRLEAADRVLQFASLAFDVAVEELFGTWAAGATVVLGAAGAPPAIPAFVDDLARRQVTVVNLPSTYWHEWAAELAAGVLPSHAALRLLIAGSEPVLPERLAQWRDRSPGAALWANAYGTTEATVTTTLHGPRAVAGDGADFQVPVGRPLANARVHLLDRRLATVPPGVAGQICIAGAGLARGYAGRPDLTAERFIPDPFSGEPGARLYVTGDLGRHTAGGELLCLGRVDRQVKVRGFRIELGEVEAALTAHPGVKEALVTLAPREGSAPRRLVAYVAPRAAPVATADLKRFLGERLPEHMVPPHFVHLESLPRLPNGKLDRQALSRLAPDIVPAAPAADTEPRSAAEAALAKIWRQVLRLDAVGVHDNFFELGGDSILAIQVVSRAGREGLHLTPRQLFERPTVAGLAAATREAQRAETAAPEGPAPLTPIQRWFFEQELPHPEHFNQALLLAAGPLSTGDRERLRAALAHVVAHHEALRLRFTPQWTQTAAAPAAQPPFVHVDLAALPPDRRAAALERAGASVHGSLDLAAGPLVRAALFSSVSASNSESEEPPDRLLLVIHHLSVDGVSWRIVLEDLESACRQLANGTEVSLPPASTPFRLWALRLAEHARSQEVAAEAAYWRERLSRPVPKLPVDLAEGPDRAGATASVSVSLTAAETRALLQEMPRSARAQIQEVLLTALAEALGRWTGSHRVLVDLETHGREELFPDLDLSRTVGWFTALFPMLLDLEGAADPVAALRAVKEQLRAVPHRGLGFGLLRHLAAGEDGAGLRGVPPEPAEVVFNYLGQIGEQASAEPGEGSLFRFARESAGPERHPLQPRQNLLEISALVAGGRLRLDFIYSTHRHRRATLEALAEGFLAALRSLLALCLGAPGENAAAYTPSDFPLARLDEASLARLAAAGAGIEDVYPLSPAQQGMLFHTLHAPDSGVYVGQLSVAFASALDVAAFEQAWRLAVSRHPILRTAFFWDELAEPLQVVFRQVPLPWEVLDWRGLDAAEQRRRLAAYLETDRRRGFDLSRPPLMRLTLVRLGDEAYHFVWSNHHVLIDGWSMPLLLNEIFLGYEAAARGEEPRLERAHPYRDYIAWLARQDLTTTEPFWRRTLAGFETPTPLGVDRLRAGPGADAPAHGVALDALPAGVTAGLRGFARRHQLTINTLVQGAWALLLGRYSGERDVVFGAVTSGRSAPVEGIESIVGLFINTLPVRLAIDPAAALLPWLQALQEMQAELRQHEHSPLAQVQGWSEVPRGRPLFESILAFENYPVDESAAQAGAGLRVAAAEVHEQTNYAVNVVTSPGDRLGFRILYDAARLDTVTVRRMLLHLMTLLERMAGGAEQALGALSPLTAAERHQAWAEWNDSDALFAGRDLTLHRLFELEAGRAPDRPAVLYGEETVTYGELERRAGRLAAFLARLDVAHGTLVGVCLERSLDAVVALLGILKTGGVYVPLDPQYPQERLAVMIEDAPVVLTRRGLVPRLPETAARVVRLDEEAGEIAQDYARPEADTRPESAGPSSLAYIIYTSGSTGRPKGVVIDHRGAVNTLLDVNSRFAVGPADRVLALSSLCFDLSVYDIFGLLAAGGAMVLPTAAEDREPARWAELVTRHRVTIWNSVPALVEMFVDHAAGHAAGGPRADGLTLRLVMMSGDWIPVTLPDRIRALGGEIVVISMGGATEASIWSILYPIREVDAAWRSIPYGRAMANQRFYVLDGALEPQPIGVRGPLYIGGVGVALGYWRDEEKTRASFLHHPRAGDRLYRTGDLGRYLPDGNIEFLGRADFQVKVRGFRIELGDIESALAGFPGVKETLAVVREDLSAAGGLVVAYVVPHEGAATPAAEELRDFLRARLPEYLVPAHFVTLAQLPLTANGKVDRQALPAPALAPADGHMDPRTPFEELLAGIFAEVLQVETIGAHDNFFELGGHSLLATQLVSRIRSTFGVDLPLRTLFDGASLAELAEAVERTLRSAAGRLLPPAIERAPRDRPLPVSFAQQRLWFFDRLEPGSPVYNIPIAVRLTGRLEAGLLRAALGEIVRRHEALRTIFALRDGEPAQVVLPAAGCPLPLLDLRGLPEPQRSAEARALATAEAQRPFDLARGPLLRCALVALGDAERLLLLTMHHIVSDAWSIGVLVRELAAFYEAFDAGRPAALPELGIQYADFARWQREWLAGEVLEEELAHWRRRLAGAPPAVDLPTDRPRPAVQTYRGGNLLFQLPMEVLAELRDLARREGATLFMSLLAGFDLLLHRHTGEPDLCIGTPVAGRNHLQTETLIGFFVNTLVLRLDLTGEPRFVDLLARAREATLDAYAHQDLPFEKLVEELQPERSLARSPLFQIMLALQNAPQAELRSADLELELLAAEGGAVAFDLSLSLMETPAGLAAALDYNRDLFDHATMLRLVAHFETLLRGLVAAPQARLSEIPLLAPAERLQLLAEWSGATVPAGPAACLHELFEARAAADPGGLALLLGDDEVSYGELDRRANRLAHHLLGMGVGPETRVGLCLERSGEMVTATLAVLKAGGAYVPLDPSYPAERLAYMTADAGIAVTLVTSRTAARLAGAAALSGVDGVDLLDLGTLPDDGAADKPAITVLPESLAYVIYTSGSTGRPKGVLVPHGAVCNSLRTAAALQGLGPGDRCLQAASPSFDAAVLETFSALISGACLCPVPPDVVPSGSDLAAELRRRRVSAAFLVPSVLATLDAAGLPALRTLTMGAEKCPADLARRWSAGRLLFNLYGPTEASIFATTWRCGAAEPAGGPPIGRPIPGARTYVLDVVGNPVPAGVAGELHLGGAAVTRGYQGRPDWTAQSFVPDPFGEPGGRLYRTGDLVRWLPDGALEILGRRDYQLKVRGFRIEPGEIEAALASHPAVLQAAVVAEASRLLAYVVPRDASAEAGALQTGLRAHLRERLPDFMQPAAFVLLAALPLTAAGKLDRRALPSPEAIQAEPQAAYVVPRAGRESAIAGIWRAALGVDRVGSEDSFFELGGHSLMLVEVQTRLREQLGEEVALLDLFRYPNVRSLARFLEDRAGVAAATLIEPVRVRPMAADRSRDIAIVGMAGRFPGAPDLETFWRNLRGGVESITFASEEELLAAGIPRELLSQPNYVPAGGVLPGADLFDAFFFDISPREARILDPQHRIYLECAAEALERAGYGAGSPAAADARIGVFAGTGMSAYGLHHLFSQPDAVQATTLEVLLGNDKDFLATRTAYKLNLRGPAFTVQTACSTALVAVHLACKSLIDGECDLALAGGVTVDLPQGNGYLYEPGGVSSADGHNRAFDASASGTVSSNGVGVVVLKPLAAALAGGDFIHAVIKASAINNDGSAKIGFTTPSEMGQAAVIAEALALAGVAPETVRYVEGHGSATPIGDPIEVAALTRAFGSAGASHGQRGSCALGSVKSNIGHTGSAAGAAGLIKTVLALEHREIPPSLHFASPNPAIDFASGPFFVNTDLLPWPVGGGAPRRAGVSSFGLGGTNVHVVLEEAPARPPAAPSRPWQLLCLSARTATALEAVTDRLAAHLESHPEADLADVAYTLQTGRKGWEERRAIVCRDREDAVAALAARDPRRLLGSVVRGTERPLAFLFAGVGEQYPGLAAGLYRDEPVFREELDRCAELLQPAIGVDLRELMLAADRGREGAAAGPGFGPDLRRMLGRGASAEPGPLDHTAVLQPVLFAIEHALARLWMSWGVTPRALLGYSLGEYVAACIAGVLSLPDALRLVVERARLIDALPEGAMLAVPLPEAETLELLTDEDGQNGADGALSLAAVNGPALSVVAGPAPAVAALESRLAARGCATRRLRTTHAFHSTMLAPAVAGLTALARQIELRPPRIPYLSNVTGTWITAGQATDPAYWGEHMVRTVRFAAALGELWREPERALLEIGPGQSLSALALQHPDAALAADPVALPSLPSAYERQPDQAFLLATLGKLWLAGAAVDGRAVYEREERRRVPLPAYPYERQRYWIDVQTQARPAAVDGRRRGIEDWLYLPAWRRSAPPPRRRPGDLRAAGERWLVFATDLGGGVADLLAADGCEVVTVLPGDGFTRRAGRAFTVDPRRREDYDALVTALEEDGPLPSRILHLWTAELRPDVGFGGFDGLDRVQEMGFYSLLFLAQAIAARLASRPPEERSAIDSLVVSAGLRRVSAADRARPELSPLGALCQALPVEFPGVVCRSVDVTAPASHRDERLARCVLSEALGSPEEPVVAWRGNERWVRSFEPLRPSAPAVPALPRAAVLLGHAESPLLDLAAHLAAAGTRLALILPALVLPEGGPPALEDLAVEAVLTADAEDEQSLRDALAVAEATLDGLDALIVADGPAGEPPLLPLALADRGPCDPPLQATARRLTALQRCLAGRDLDLCLLISSLDAVAPGPGHGLRAAVHGLVDAWAQEQEQESPFPWTAVDWDRGVWSQVGFEEAPAGISRQEAAEVLTRLLALGPLPQVVVSPEDLASRLRRTAEPPLPAAAGSPVSRHARPNLRNPYVPPVTETERQVAEIWQRLLGIDPVGLHDSFFDLGGDSLLATQVATRVREGFGVEVPLPVFFELPTPAALAQQVDALRPAVEGEAEKVARMLEQLDSLSAEEVERMLAERGVSHFDL